MMLPDGLREDTACVLIALRELFDDPHWTHPAIVENMLMNTGGNHAFVGHPYDALKQVGLYIPDEYTMPIQSGNATHVTLHVAGDRVRIPRQSKCIWFYETSKDNAHAVCTSAVQWANSFSRFSPWFVAFHPWGMIIDRPL